MFYLGFSGIDLNMSDVNSILENTNRLILLEISSFDHNWESFRDLRNQYGVQHFIRNKDKKNCCENYYYIVMKAILNRINLINI